MKSSSLSSLTIHGIAAPNGVDSESVSWPTRMCIFCRRRIRCGSRPNGRIPWSLARLEQRVPEVLAVGGGAVDLVAELADEADPQDQARHAGDRRVLAVEVLERLVGAVEVGDLVPGSRAPAGPARLTAARPWVMSVSWTSMPQSASHQENHSSTAPAPLEVVVT